MAVFLGVFGAAALVMGCGGGGDDALTKAEFTKQANGICKELLSDAEAEMSAWSKSKEKNAEGEQVNAQGETVSEIMGGYYTTKAERLGELNPPEAEQDQFDEMLAALDRAIEEGEETPERFVSGSKSLEEVGAASTELGLECNS
ncbi:MAG TPA: hypothetical protein VFX85_07295 [Solirubrobacterales bacterium]|nr:hypothetical protein [Solirubrobacterales bacterium]